MAKWWHKESVQNRRLSVVSARQTRRERSEKILHSFDECCRDPLAPDAQKQRLQGFGPTVQAWLALEAVQLEHEARLEAFLDQRAEQDHHDHMVREFELLRQEELAAKLRVFLESDHTTAKQQHKLHSDFRSLKKEEAMLEYLRLREDLLDLTWEEELLDHFFSVLEELNAQNEAYARATAELLHRTSGAFLPGAPQALSYLPEAPYRPKNPREWKAPAPFRGPPDSPQMAPTDHPVLSPGPIMSPPPKTPPDAGRPPQGL